MLISGAAPHRRHASGIGAMPRAWVCTLYDRSLSFLFRNVRQRTEQFACPHKNRPQLHTAELTQAKGRDMNSVAWIGIILWGVLLTAFGLVSTGPVPQAAPGDMAAQDVFFLITGGLLTCLIGVLGLMGFMGWIPGLHKEQKSAT
jgi:hypothetical protein